MLHLYVRLLSPRLVSTKFFALSQKWGFRFSFHTPKEKAFIKLLTTFSHGLITSLLRAAGYHFMRYSSHIFMAGSYYVPSFRLSRVTFFYVVPSFYFPFGTAGTFCTHLVLDTFAYEASSPNYSIEFLVGTAFSLCYNFLLQQLGLSNQLSICWECNCCFHSAQGDGTSADLPHQLLLNTISESLPFTVARIAIWILSLKPYQVCTLHRPVRTIPLPGSEISQKREGRGLVFTEHHRSLPTIPVVAFIHSY